MSAVALRLPLYFKTGIAAFSFASQHRPLITGIATTTCISVLGDISCQYIAYKHSNQTMYNYNYNNNNNNNNNNNHHFIWNYKRTLKFGLTGFVFAPQIVLWYKYVQKALPGQSIKIAAKRVMMDQAIFASWSTVYFLSFNKYLEGENYMEMKNQINEKWKDTYIANTLLWPPFQFINFWLIPAHFRVLGTNLVSLGWCTYLSFKTHQ